MSRQQTTISCPRRSAGAVITTAALGMALLLSAAPARADTAVVPDDFAVIQDAVDAVQGTADATVIIESDATFSESLTLTDSVNVEAGAGFAPTIQGTTFFTVSINPPDTAADTGFALTGLRLLPRPDTVSSDAIVNLSNGGSGTMTTELVDLTIESPDDVGPTAVDIRIPLTADGSNDVQILDSTFNLGGEDGLGGTGIFMGERGSLTVDNLDLTMVNGPSHGFDIRGSQDEIQFELTDSVFDISAPAGSFTAEVGVLLDEVTALIAGNTFLLHTSDMTMGSADGINLGDEMPQDVTLDANRIFGFGPNTRSAVSIANDSGGPVTLVATNQVIQGMDDGFSFVPQDADSEIDITLTNNTIVDSLESAIRFSLNNNGIVNATVYNNLLTHSNAFGVEILNASGSMFTLDNDYNGYFANGSGDTSAGTTPGPNALAADPGYVDRPGGDLRLAATSPAINAGDNAAPGIPSTDADGAGRIQFGTVDLGAFESPDEPVGEPVAETVPVLGATELLVLIGLVLIAGLAARHRHSRKA